MKPRKYLYTGPLTGVTLKDGEAEREVMLHPGQVVELPPNHDYTKTLVALGHLAEVEAPAPRAAETATGGKPATTGGKPEKGAK